MKGDFVLNCTVYKLGLVEYSNTYRLQKNLHRKRAEEKISDSLLLLEHPPTFTIGKFGSFDNLLVSINRLRQEGIGLFLVERGGDVTYHGPGQLVAYPIICMKKRGKDVHQYVYNLEEVVLRVLKDFGINADRDNSHAGLWVNKEQIAAIGISVRRWVAMHGFALNVDINLNHFSLINFCGFSDRIASTEVRRARASPRRAIAPYQFIAHFSDVFNTVIRLGAAKEIAQYI